MDQKLIDAIYEARAQTSDAARPDVVSKRHADGYLTPRERISALLDAGSAVEYGALSGYAPERGWVPERGGVDFVGTVDGQTVVTSSTDFTDRGGGYGAAKIPRLFDLAREHRWPVVLFADGGGSRATVPGAAASGIGLGSLGRLSLFDGMAELSGWVPLVVVVSGPSYAGHASLAGFSDFLVATPWSSIGMGGPPLVEAALGVRVSHQELASTQMHERLGGIDLLVPDEPAAIEAVRRYLSYYQDLPSGEPSPTAGAIGSLVPDHGSYDMHEVIEAIIDAESMFELRPRWRDCLITALGRMDGRTVGILANQPSSKNGGAIDQGAADKIARFVELCDAYEYPIVSLIDTPGLTLRRSGEDEAEQPGMTRHHARPLLAHHHRTVPLFSVQIRRGYGLGSFAMTGIGNTQATPGLRLAWPTVELGVEDGYSASVHDSNAFDDVIDPAETRGRIVGVLRGMKRTWSQEKKHRIDSW